MSGLKAAFNFYINSSIHLSIAIVCLAGVTYLNFRIPVNYELLIFIFLGSVTGYNFIKYAGIAKLHHFRLEKNVRIIQIFSFFVFLGLLFSAYYQPLRVLLWAGVMGLFTLLYAVPVFSEKRNLRGIPGIKIYVIAFVVAGVTVLMPLLDARHLLSWDVLLDFVQRFIIVLVLVLPFEIRDLKFDMARLGTIPQILGVRGTKILGYILTGFFILLEFLKLETHFPYLLSLLALGGIAILAIKYSFVRQGKYYASFWVEAVPIAWFLILALLSAVI